jgi:hypothetical protein
MFSGGKELLFTEQLQILYDFDIVLLHVGRPLVDYAKPVTYGYAPPQKPANYDHIPGFDFGFGFNENHQHK